MRLIMLLSVLFLLPLVAIAGEIDLRTASGGTVVLRDFNGVSDSRGVMAEYELLLPAYDKAVYYQGGWWPAGGNRVYGHIVEAPDAPEGGIFLLLSLRDGGYLAFLPLCGEQAYAWLAGGDAFRLKVGTHGNAPVQADVPLYAFARASDPYEACAAAWARAADCVQIKGYMKLRENKPYPEMFEFLGWCSWEQYHGNISQGNMVQAMEDIEASGLPIRYVLIDDGHFDRQTLQPNEKFPDGYRALADLRKPDKIRWLGMWYAFLGDNHGVKSPGGLGAIAEHMVPCEAGKLLPKPAEPACRAFYEYLFARGKRDGVDFLKVDFQSDALTFYAGSPKGNGLGPLPNDNTKAFANPLAASVAAARTFQSVVAEQFGGLINCNWHNAPSLFNSMDSSAGRCSEDYKAGDLAKAKAHLYHSYAAIPWLGQIAWGDHDMFHSNDPFAGRMMAVSKALSGGPVYLSDGPTDFAPEVIRPLCYDDGRLLRPLAPAAPLRADLFQAMDEAALYRVAAPLANDAAMVCAYNLHGGVEAGAATLKTVLTAEDYADAFGMTQPLRRPEYKNLLIYDWQAGTAKRLKGTVEVAIRGFGDRLFQISPIIDGWSMVGRADKYLPGAAVEIVSREQDVLVLRLEEPGPLTVWSGKGMPQAPDLTFKALGGGLYRADMPVGGGPVELTLKR